VTIPAAEQGDSPINPMTLSKLLGDDTDKHYAILRKFIPQAEGIIAEINTASGVRDAQQTSFLAHKLKSSARMVGADTLADLCQNLEVASKDTDWPDWPTINSLCYDLAPAVRLVTKFINNL
jgi:HPt (histidine-containing phosphotransfer) domain-containing protein